MNPVNCPRCGTQLFLCTQVTATARQPVQWAADTRVEDLPVRARAKHIANHAKWDDAQKQFVPTHRFRTAGDVDAATDWELLSSPNFGRESLRELRDAIKALKENGA